MENMTDDVKVLLGDPKKAVVSIALPITIAMIAEGANNVIDAVCVAGLGEGAMAAVGFVFPLFFILIGVSNGICVGASYAISKRIGGLDKKSAENAIAHTVIISLVASIILAIVLAILLEPLVLMSGAGDILQYCKDYGYIIIICAPISFVSIMFSGLLRSEGAAKRSMVVMITAAILNAIISPILIYVFGMGISGAAVGTVVALALATIPSVYWYFVKKDTFLRVNMKSFKSDPRCYKDILKVGLPSSLEFVVMSVVSVVMNMILMIAGGTGGLAVYTSGWRIIQFVAIPAMGIGAALVPVCAAAYGARQTDKIKIAYAYAIKISSIVMLALALLLALTSGITASIFTFSPGMEGLKDQLTTFILIASIFIPFIGMGVLATSLFQSVGKGISALIASIFRNALMLPICYMATITGSLVAVWWGITFAEVIGAVLIATWSLLMLKALIAKTKQPEKCE